MTPTQTVVLQSEYTRKYKGVISVGLSFEAACFSPLLAL